MADILILMADDMTRKRLGELLGGDHFQVIATGDAEMGRALMRHAQFDVVIADTNLRGDNGIEVIAQVQNLLPGAEVIAVTATSMGRSAFFKSYVGQLHVSHCFTVPFDNAALLRAARNLMSAQRKRHRAAAAVAMEAKEHAAAI